MQYIDMQTWNRRKHFELFNAFDSPHFNLCADIDITAIHRELPRSPFSFTVIIVYVLTKAANAITEFRYRIREGQVVEHDMIHPSPTILQEDDLFSFCTIPFNDDFKSFAAEAAAPKVPPIPDGAPPIIHPTLRATSYPTTTASINSFPDALQISPTANETGTTVDPG